MDGKFAEASFTVLEKVSKIYQRAHYYRKIPKETQKLYSKNIVLLRSTLLYLKTIEKRKWKSGGLRISTKLLNQV